MAHVVAINRTMQLALLDDHVTEVPFVMLDEDDQETEDVKEGVTAILELPDGEPVELDLTAWQPVTLH